MPAPRASCPRSRLSFNLRAAAGRRSRSRRAAGQGAATEKKGLPRPVTPDEARECHRSGRKPGPREDWIGARDRAVLLLLYGSGLRIAEALSLTGRDAIAGVMCCKSPARGANSGLSRSFRLRAPPWPNMSDCAHGRYRRRSRCFAGSRAVPCRPAWCRRRWRRPAAHWACPILPTPHALRHSFATHLLSRRRGFAFLAGIARPCIAGSTQILYPRRCRQPLLENYRNAHPRAGRRKRLVVLVVLEGGNRLPCHENR